MNITQLQYLVDVGELGSFTEAAKKSRMTVPTISISISQLEIELDVVLFSRSRKGVVPTNEGKKVIQHAISILKSVDKMKDDISFSKDIIHGNIVIATIPGMVPKIIDTTLELQKSYRHVNVQMLEVDSSVVVKQVKNGHADIGFLSTTTNNHDPALTWQSIVKDEALLVVNKNSALRFYKSISGDEIKNETFVLYNDPAIKMIAENLFLREETNRVALISNNVEALYRMVNKGNAITIATEYIIESLPPRIRDEIITISIKEITSIPNYLWRITRKNENSSAIIDKFTDQLLTQLLMIK
ncbi:LysR family transcriptional regulator [Paenisporosarcina sp. TG20]|uniref:LysR family transcriptional regulator n=1 Tax=Paenisporosarcina sp. TG20 TaxID=1211706 RepID=UPI0002D4BCAC|nr:LysR family transcriptional regulator [Paenisporosarcina sp. TG20]